MAERILKTKVSLVNKTAAEWAEIASTTVPYAGCACIEWVDEAKKLAKVKYGNGISTYAELEYSTITEAEVLELIAQNAKEVTIEESSAEGYAKSYTFKQGEDVIGTVNIPLDMVVSSGEVMTDPDSDHVGTFLVLTIANKAQDKVYVNIGEIIKAYTVEASAAMVQLAINEHNEISATIVDGSITKAKLANDVTDVLDKAVTTDDTLVLNCIL